MPRISLVSALFLIFWGACTSDSNTPNPSDSGAGSDASQPSTSDAGATTADSGGGSTSRQDAGTGGIKPPPTCKEGASAANPTWTIIDPKLPDFEASVEMLSAVPATKGFVGVAYGNGLFVALGASISQDAFHWATSADGVTWKSQSEKLTKGTTYTTSQIHFLNGKFIFFAEHKDDGFQVHSSPDAKTWTVTKILDVGERAQVSDFAASDTQTVYAGHTGDMRSSPDLITWTARPDVAGNFFDFMDIAYGGGRWIATGNGGAPAWGSDDGVTWTTLDDSLKGLRMAFGGGLWLATTGGGVAFTSTDGKTFTDVSQPITDLNPGRPPTFAGGRFLTMRADIATEPSRIGFSKDGKTWSAFGTYAAMPALPGDAPVQTWIADIAYGNCRYVMAGVRVSGPAPTLAGPNIQTHTPLIITADLSK